MKLNIKKGKNNFEKYENVRKQINIKLTTTERRRNYIV